MKNRNIHLINPFGGAFPVTFITISWEITQDKILSAGVSLISRMKAGDLNFMISNQF